MVLLKTQQNATCSHSSSMGMPLTPPLPDLITIQEHLNNMLTKTCFNSVARGLRKGQEGLTSKGCLLWSLVDVEELVSLSVFLRRTKSAGKQQKGAVQRSSQQRGSRDMSLTC